MTNIATKTPEKTPTTRHPSLTRELALPERAESWAEFVFRVAVRPDQKEQEPARRRGPENTSTFGGTAGIHQSGPVGGGPGGSHG